jgi:hypothetical protein
MRPISLTLGILATASANNIAQSQTTAGAANLLINGSAAFGGVATLDQARRVLLTDLGNDTGTNFTVTGTNRYGQKISEVLAGTNGGIAGTNNDFLTVTNVATSAATSASGVTVGTNTIASILVPIEMYGQTNLVLSAAVTGSVNFTVNETWDDPYLPTGLYPVNFQAIAAFSGKTSSMQVALINTIRALQFVINSGSGSVAFDIVQSGVLAV